MRQLILSIIFSIAFQYGPEKTYNDSGYIDLDDKRHLFYWFFESRSSPETAPLVLWMTGGPGCSGMLALFVENGPYQVDDQENLTLNPYSWTEVANVIWIDQPVGAGFSYSDTPSDAIHSEHEMATDVYNFLVGFFAKYPKYKDSEFYIVGESYGGHYVPALGSFIIDKNSSKDKPITINFKGVGIGNGLVDPLLQYPQYSEYLKENKLVSETVYTAMRTALPACTGLISACKSTILGRLACDMAIEVCNATQVSPLLAITGKNNYDIRKECTVPPLCYDFSNVENLLNDKEVQAGLGVKAEKWASCNMYTNLNLTLSGDWMLSYAESVKTILDTGAKVLVYSGDQDFVCNWKGGYAWVQALDWKYKDQFSKLELVEYMDYENSKDGNLIGWYKAYENLTFIRVKDAGHMVPMDQPQNALYLFKELVSSTEVLE